MYNEFWKLFFFDKSCLYIQYARTELSLSLSNENMHRTQTESKQRVSQLFHKWLVQSIIN